MAFRTITATITTKTTTYNKLGVWLFVLLLAVPNILRAQIINEAAMRQDINNTITTNANKQITGALHRALMQRLVTFITNGSGGIIADSLVTANYIPFFKTTGMLANSPFRVGTNAVGLNTAATVNHFLTIGAPSVDAAVSGTSVRLGNSGGSGSGIQFDGGGASQTGSLSNLSGNITLQAAKEATLSGVDSAAITGGNGIFMRSGNGPIRFATGLSNAIRMNINSIGNIHIGGVSPSYKLDITGDLRSTTGAYFATSSGNVGVGTTIPLSRLQVIGQTSAVASPILGSLTNSVVFIGNSSLGYGLNVVPSGDGSVHIQNQRIDGTSTIYPITLNPMGGRVGIGTNSPATSGALDITSTTGALIITRLTTSQRNALTPVNGMLIYNTTNNKLEGYENGAWVNLHN